MKEHEQMKIIIQTELGLNEKQIKSYCHYSMKSNRVISAQVVVSLGASQRVAFIFTSSALLLLSLHPCMPNGDIPY